MSIVDNEFVLEGGRTGVMLIHGLTGTPNEMRVVAKGLHRAGFTVYCVQLAGHCGTEEDLLATTWRDWYASVEAGAERLKKRVDNLFVGGLSMGALLALRLAAQRPDLVDGVAAYATMFRHDGWSMPAFTRLAFLLPVFRALGIGRHRSFLEQPPYGIKDENLRKRIVAQMQSGDSSAAGLPGNPWWAVAEMSVLSSTVRRQLRDIQSPCLVVHATEDDVASLRNAELIARRVTQAPVEMLLLKDSYHMVTIDRERRTVINKTIEFINRIVDEKGKAMGAAA
ncbi:alpha/beta fold hydrolase [Pigmentiphaga aceris]|uniref:Alpha/beta fold hydrolase n=1 Tax=Pigmentiphaga aceris TaxID=1940612 RepID=A0A5C0AUI0_9BURK|nr:alpha/beta fold hydrolase [Pigmentiphaga aceris]QEI05968.1 alpha/beta fold hydrolase [Pigmentiphaga aceris]